MHSLNFIYFIIFVDINIIIENIGGEVNSDNFVLNKYIVRSSLNINNTYNKFVVHNLFNKSVLGNTRGWITLKQLTMFTKVLDTSCFISTKSTFKMAGYFPTLAVLS